MQKYYKHLNFFHCTEKAVKALRDAVKSAIDEGRELLTPEHVLYEITLQEEFISVCNENGFDIDGLRQGLTEYVKSIDTASPGTVQEVIPSMLLSQLTNLINTNNRIVYDSLSEKDKDMHKLLSVCAPTCIASIIISMMELDDSVGKYLLFKYLGNDTYALTFMLMEAYSKDLRDYYTRELTDDVQETNGEHLEEGEDEQDDDETNQPDDQDDASDEPDDQDDASDEDFSIEFPQRHVSIKIIDDIGVLGTGKDANKKEIYSKLMETADRLFGSLNKLGKAQGEGAGIPFVAMGAKPNNQQKDQRWKQYVTNLNLTETAHQCFCREKETERALRVLARKDKHNPLFVGEPGVGKTTVVYGLAKEFNKERMEGKPLTIIYSLDVGTLMAGTSFHGEFEKRLKMILEGLMEEGDCILFIDDIHSLINTGGNQMMSATDILKPYLEASKIRVIGATSYSEYNKNIANMKPIARYFELIDVREPNTEETLMMIEPLLPVYEEHHRAKYKIDAVKYAIEQSHLLINDRYLPDKALDVIDEAGAYRKTHRLLSKRGVEKHNRYQYVDKQVIDKILTEVCRIDEKALKRQTNDLLKDLDKRIGNEIYGQDEAIRQVVNAVMMSKAGLLDPNKPIASLLFVGPTGVGKTEVCRVLAKELGIELLRFDMSEYTEKHTVSKLIGSPAGYVGYEEGGLLTDAVRKTPHCVLLLDEIEKAHPDIYNILLQVMDYAKLTDNKGNKADFRNVILVMTSNAGAQYAGQANIGFNNSITKGQAMLNTVKKTFKPEFINRLSGTVVFNEMDRKMACLILDKKLRQLSQRLERKNVTVTLTDEARQQLIDEGFSSQFGAREMDRVIQRRLTPLLMEEILFGKLKNGGDIVVGKDMLKS